MLGSLHTMCGLRITSIPHNALGQEITSDTDQRHKFFRSDFPETELISSQGRDSKTHAQPWMPSADMNKETVDKTGSKDVLR